jgi:hypothetical protein
MQSPETQYTTQRTFASPAATGRDCDWACNVVFVVVHDQSQRPVEEVFDKFTETGFTTDETFGTADDIVAVGKQASYIGWRVGSYVEDVPDIFGERERCPLQRDT